MNGDLGFVFGEGFDPNSYEPQEDFTVLVPGKYPVMIETAEVKPTKAGSGHYLELQMKIVEGPCTNRKLWDRINIDNPNAKCVEIGCRVLSALARSVGLPAVQDTSQLVDKCCIASVKVKDNQNEVRTYLPYQAQQQAPPPQQQQAPPVYQAPQQPAQAAPVQQQYPQGQPQQAAQTQPPAQQPGNPGFQQQPAAAGVPPWAR